MRIWKLEIIDEERIEKIHPASYSEYMSLQGAVVVAETEEEARAITMKEAGLDEGDDPWWLDPAITSCEEIDSSGPARFVLGNWPTG